MAQLSAIDIIRQFGTRMGDINPNINLAVPTSPTAIPQPSINIGAMPTAAPTAAPAPTQGSNLPTPTPSFSRPPTAPMTVGGVPTGGSSGGSFAASGSGGQFLGDPNSIKADPEYLAAIKARAAGGGMPTYNDIRQGQYDPTAGLIDQAAEQSGDLLARDLARRGVLSGGESASVMSDLRNKQFLEKGALAGELAGQFEQMRQSNINQALQTWGVLEGNLIDSKTRITTTNTASLAQVKSASIAASAQRYSADAGVKIAQINAKATLQRANMDFGLAIKQLDRQLEMSGIDPLRFENDPIYRGDILDQRATAQRSKDLLINAQLYDVLGRLPGGISEGLI